MSFRSKAWAILGKWLVGLGLGWVLAWPWSEALNSQGFSQFADGDARLLSAGGAYLLEALRLGVGSFQSLLLPTLVTGIGVTLVSLVPLAGLAEAACSDEKLGPNALLARAVGHFWQFAVLQLCTWLLAALLFVGLYVGQATFRATSADTQQADLRSLGFVAVGLCLGACLGCIQDVLRMGLVRAACERRLVDALGISLRTLRSEGLRLFFVWAFLASLCAALAAGGGAFALKNLSTHPSLSFGGQQLICLALITLRLFWFMTIAKAIARTQKNLRRGLPRLDETPANSGELADPS